MKNKYVYAFCMVVIVLVLSLAFLRVSKTASSRGEDCSKYSSKDGYTGCMSIVQGKEKVCKFKVDNTINETTQKMEFTYTCMKK